MKSKEDKLDVDKLVPVPVDLSKLSNVVKSNASLNAKINEVKGEIPNITNLATTTALTVVENKIPNVSNLVKNTDYNTKISEIEIKSNNHNHDKNITTPEFNKLTAKNFSAKLKQANYQAKVILLIS